VNHKKKLWAKCLTVSENFFSLMKKKIIGGADISKEYKTRIHKSYNGKYGKLHFLHLFHKYFCIFNIYHTVADKKCIFQLSNYKFWIFSYFSYVFNFKFFFHNIKTVFTTKFMFNQGFCWLL
jgi:hypothetical protein